MKEPKEIKEIIDLGRRLDELTYDVYSQFTKREDFDPHLVALWTELADWKKNHIKHWKKLAKGYTYKNIFKRPPDELQITVKQLKNIQSELIEFLRRMRKKKVPQSEAISQTVLNEYCLVSDIFLELFYTYDEAQHEPAISVISECQMHVMKMANTLKPYLKLNPLYAALLKSIIDLKQKHEILLLKQGKIRKAVG